VDVIGDRYELRERIGVGAMATVWRGWDTRLHRFVAVKLLARALGADPSFIARFEREARHAASLNHPNIVTIFDFGTENDVSYLVMELVEGESLADLLRRVGRLNPPQTVAICSGVLSGLSAAHQHGVIHRDIKPSNILLGSNGVVKVADFGIARAANEITALTDTGVIMGTVSYLSPEQCAGAPATQQSDVYAVGCLAYECLAGRPPFVGENPASVMYQHQYAEPQSIISQRPDVPPALAAVIGSALQKDPRLRFSDSTEMWRALAQPMTVPHGVTMADETPVFDPEQTTRMAHTSQITVPPIQPDRPKKRTHRRVITVAAAIVVLVAAAAAAGILTSRHPRSNVLAATGHSSHHSVSTTKSTAPPARLTPTTATTPVSATPTLTVNECPSSYGVQGTPSSRIPSTIAVSLPSSEADQLAFYSDSTRSVDPVLAPAGWSCSVSVGADGSTTVAVFPPGESDPNDATPPLPATTQGVIAYSPSACQGCIADLVCPVFPNAESQLGYVGQSCGSAEPPSEQATFLSGSASDGYGTVDLTDPPGVQGTVAMSGGDYQGVGVLVFADDQNQGEAAMESCVLPASDSALCSAITSDFVNRGWGFDS
jgi:eukaryotic-like serine/threonine-protein kinase